MFLKNAASQKIVVFAWDTTTGLAKTGDAANITAYVSKDYGSVTVLGDTSATEMDSTNAKGNYLFDLTQAETNAEVLVFTAKSSTANIAVIGAPQTIFTMPTTGVLSPATLGRTAVVDASGLIDANMVKAGPTGSGTAQTARDVGGAVPAAAAGASGGLLISGSNSGTTTLGALTCTGAFTISDGIAVTRSTANSAGMTISGNGSGNGLTVSGGAASGATAGGIGVSVAGGAGGTTGASAAGVSITGGVAGSTSGNASPALKITGGAAAAGTGTGAEAVNATGGAASTTATGGNAYTITGGVAATGKAGGLGLSITGGAASTTGAGGIGIKIVGADGGTTSAGQHAISAVSGASGTTSANAGNAINLVAGNATAGSGTAGIGVSIAGGTATSTGTAGVGASITGGAGAASSNGAASGVTIVGGGTNTVASNAHGLSVTGSSTGNGVLATSGSGATGDGIKGAAASTNGNGITGVKAGSGNDFNCTSTPLTLAKTTNITGLNDIAATAVVSAGAITTSGGKVSGVILTDTVTTYTGNTVQTGDAYARLGAPAGASVSADVAAINTKTTNLPAAPASTTNITAGTITTVTNLTNAPTAGDFTATMKTSIGTAVAASAVASVTGNVGGNVTGSVGSVTGLTVSNLDATVSSRLASASYTAPANSDITAIKAKTDNLPAAPAAVGDIPTANQNADALLDRAAGVETGITPRQGLRLMLASLAGKLSGAAGTTISIRDTNDSKNRIVATVDSNGNRSAITLDAS